MSNLGEKRHPWKLQPFQLQAIRVSHRSLECCYSPMMQRLRCLALHSGCISRGTGTCVAMETSRSILELRRRCASRAWLTVWVASSVVLELSSGLPLDINSRRRGTRRSACTQQMVSTYRSQEFWTAKIYHISWSGFATEATSLRFAALVERYSTSSQATESSFSV